MCVSFAPAVYNPPGKSHWRTLLRNQKAIGLFARNDVQGQAMHKYDRTNANGYEIAVTPGEEIQNWLARYNICQPVPVRSYDEPEPPPGIWSSLNIGVIVMTVSLFATAAWLLFYFIRP
jgi:hypothetical protein